MEGVRGRERYSRVGTRLLHLPRPGQPATPAPPPSVLPPSLQSLPQAMVLVRSPLLQGAALEALQAFFAALAARSASAPPPPPALSDKALLAALLEAGGGSRGGGGPSGATGRQAQQSAALCVAALCCSQGRGDAAVAATAGVLLERLAAKGDPRLPLLCLGEIGRRRDLSALPQVGRGLQ